MYNRQLLNGTVYRYFLKISELFVVFGVFDSLWLMNILICIEFYLSVFCYLFVHTGIFLFKLKSSTTQIDKQLH